MKNVATILRSRQEFMDAMSIAATQQLLVVDTEFEKCDKYGEANLIGISWGYPMGAEFHSFYAPFRHREFHGQSWNFPIELLQEFDRFPHKGTQVYHNWLADHNILLKEGLDFSDRFIFDTMVACHLVDENEQSFKLDDLARKRFKARKLSLTGLEKEVGWEHIPPQVMGSYACTDVYLTFRLYMDVLPGLHQQDLWNLYQDYAKFLKVLHKVISRGLHIDVDLAKQLQEDGRRELNQLTEKYNFNLGSPQKVAAFLHGELGIPVKYRTLPNKVTGKGGGQPSTSSLHLRRYQDEYPDATDFTRDVLRYRTVNKAVGTWYEGFVAKRGIDGLLHPGLTVVGGGKDDEGGTKTGRLSCREPNLQQVPRKGSVRKLFIDPPGYRLVELDYSQAELRLIGHYMELYGDNTVAEAYRRNDDIHSITAENMGLTVALDFKSARQVGKTCNFSLAYRAGASQLRTILYRDADMAVTEAQARAYHSAWHQAYPVIQRLNQEAEYRADKVGFVKMWNGRRRHLQGSDCYKAFNSVVQGGVGQVMIEAMIAINHALPHLKMVLQVHDSLAFYLQEDTVDEDVKAIKEIMETVPSSYFSVPFVVDWKYWNEN